MDFIAVNGHIYTARHQYETFEAMAIDKKGRFMMLGTNQMLRKAFPCAPQLDLKGKYVYPGFVDAHAHLFEQGLSMCEVSLLGCSSPNDIVQRLKQYVEHHKDHKGWLIGSGWDQNLFPDKKFPHRAVLDKVFPDIPVWLKRVDFHAAWANSATLHLVGKLPTEDPQGGSIIRDEKGEPTGVFLDNAMDLINVHIPLISEKEQYRLILLATKECNKYGITSIHDAMISEDIIQNIQKAIDKDEFTLRVYGMIESVFPKWRNIPKIIDYGEKLTVQSSKIVLDGALGSRGAALFSPYSDDSENTGLLLVTPEEFYKEVKQWILAGFQVNTHAIGDRANHIVVDTYKRVVEELGLIDKDLRLRVEHAQIVSEEDLEVFKKFKLVASVQPTHATRHVTGPDFFFLKVSSLPTDGKYLSDMIYAEQRLGPERIRGAYRWKSFLDNGVHIAFGSDFPIEQVNPLLGIYAAVTRQDLLGNPSGGWYPSERVSRFEALQGFTINAAYAAFQENKVGSIAVGLLADFVILEEDIMTIEPIKIPTVKILNTFLGGKEVYSSPFSPVHKTVPNTNKINMTSNL